MMYLKLSIRNARRAFVNYLLYAVTMTLLLTMTELSNCIAIVGKLADFQTISLPLFIAVIQIILVGYIDTFMLRQRAKEFASYLLLGMGKKKLTNLFLCEILLIGLSCFLAGTAIGFVLYLFFCFRMMPHERNFYGLLFCKSMFYTLCCFCLVEIICTVRLKKRFGKLEIRELMHEKNRNQSMKNADHYKKWGIVFLSSFVCFIGFVLGIVFLPENCLVYIISVIVIPLVSSVFAFYKWIFSYLYAHRRKKSAALYRKNRLYIASAITASFQTSAAMNAVFCLCFLFSAFSFIIGLLMLQPSFRLFEKSMQQWMGTMQISICIVLITIYFSILALQQMIEFRQAAKNYRILHYMGKSSKQLAALAKQQTAVKLVLPMIMALLIFLFCMPLLDRKMNLLLPAVLHNVIFKFGGAYFLCIFFFYSCYFFIVYAMGRQYIKGSA